MGTVLLNQIKKQASSFLQEKFKIARITFTDVTEAELLAEEATNNDPCGPDARTMSKIAIASFDIDNYWRIVDVLHKRFENADWKLQWRQTYKALVLLEYLLTHGPEDLAGEFQYDIDVIQELCSFQYIDDKGFDWGVQMQKRSDTVQNLLLGREELKEARQRALKTTKGIKGFGNSPGASSSSSSSSSASSQVSSFSSFSVASSVLKNGEDPNKRSNHVPDNAKLHDFFEENGSITESDEERGEEVKKDSLIGGIYSKLVGYSPLKKFQGDRAGFRGFSNVEKVTKRKHDRQYSLGY